MGGKGPLSGLKLGDYVLKQEIDRGEFSIVGKAFDKDHKVVAIKRYIASCTNQTAQITLKAIANLKTHENLVHFPAIFFHAKKPRIYIVQDYIDTLDLNDYILKSNVTTERKFGLMSDIVQGVDFLHSNGVIHTDIRPVNIIMALGESRIICKLTDYGYAPFVKPKSKASEQRKLNLFFRAPEVKEVAQFMVASDIFALGQVLYVIITRVSMEVAKKPYLVPAATFKGEMVELSALSKKGVIRNVLSDTCTNMQVLCEMMSQMLSINPQNRPSAKDVAAAVKTEEEEQHSRAGTELLQECQEMKHLAGDLTGSAESSGTGSSSSSSSNVTKEDVVTVEQRLETFKDWPKAYILSSRKMAEAGFYFTGQTDETGCYACDLTLIKWEEGDEPWKEHIKHSPQCPHVQGRRASLHEEKEERKREVTPVETEKKAYEEKGTTAPTIQERKKKRNSGETAKNSEERKRETKPPIPEKSANLKRLSDGRIRVLPPVQVGTLKIPDKKNLITVWQRLKTFEDWPKADKHPPRRMAEAGFYYTGKQVNCYTCDLGGIELEDSMDPWQEHVKHSPYCPHLQKMKPGLKDEVFAKKYPIEVLRQTPAPNGVDIRFKEQYLTDEDFLKELEMTKEDFAGIRQWQKDKKKREARLF